MHLAAVDPLPFIDEHAVRIRAGPDAVWSALGPTLVSAFDRPRSRWLAQRLGTRDQGSREDGAGARFELVPGATLPGFRVVEVVPFQSLALEGRHRFAEYALSFHLSGDPAETIVRAETRASFPGIRGRIYHALVIGSRGHVVVVRRMLRALARRAEARSSER